MENNRIVIATKAIERKINEYEKLVYEAEEVAKYSGFRDAYLDFESLRRVMGLLIDKLRDIRENPEKYNL